MSLTTMTFAGALNQALADAIEADDSVVVFGEDVGTLGGVFRITDGLAEKYGRERCFDTPLAESGIAGMAIGMAMNRMRPVIEMQFDAFAYPAFEQVASHLAKMHNRTKGGFTMPVTVRIPHGGGIGGVEHHCDSSESLYAHIAGLKVFVPASVADAYLMLREAIASNDPVMFMEPKKLYWTKAEVDLDELRAQAEAIIAGKAEKTEGKGAVRREGADVTLISYGTQVSTCMSAAEAAAEEGYDVEVIDLRTIVPLDEEIIYASVRKTGRAVVVAEPQGFASIASELVARTQEACFHSLAAPVKRVTGFDVPYPSPKVEEYFLPSVDRILDTIDQLQWEYE